MNPRAESASPLTGLVRQDWADLADRILLAVRPYASPGRALIELPGPVSRNGADSDRLEGFARTLLLAGFRLAGEDGRDPLGLAQWYAEGLAAGTDPGSPERWPRPAECHQARVEAASIALILDLTRPWLWDVLDDGVQARVVDYLATVVGRPDFAAETNWLWFRIVTQTFLRSVGGPWDHSEIEQDLAMHDALVDRDGWIRDGTGRNFDHYAGWALHLYPTLWSRMSGAADLAGDRVAGDLARLDRFLQDAVRLIGANGAPLVQGRSLTYRFATAAPLWVGAMARVPSTSPGLLRRAASGILRHFTDRGVPDEKGLLSIGWYGPWHPIRQTYTGHSSPYWASKGMLGLALPADDPVWTAVEEPLPIEQEDQAFVVHPAGWLVSGTRTDGIVRVVNHGTDHDEPGSTAAESPLYARLGYSTATWPLQDPAAWTDPLDGAVVLLDGAGRATHRAGLRPVDLHGPDEHGVLAGSSVVDAHWVTPAEEQDGFGYGLVAAISARAGRLTLLSVVRGPWEVRAARVDRLTAGVGPGELRVGGWAVDDPSTVQVAEGAVRVTGAEVASVLVPFTEGASPAAVRTADAGPVGSVSVTPVARTPVRPGRWVGTAVGLVGAAVTDPQEHLRATAPLEVRIAPEVDAVTVSVTWPDLTTTTRLGVPTGDPTEEEHA